MILGIVIITEMVIRMIHKGGKPRKSKRSVLIWANTSTSVALRQANNKYDGLNLVQSTNSLIKKIKSTRYL